ncbi:MAG TPA: hypothetical protein PKN56_17990 [Leptospiraceae bacterium]|nr:hypothetical protein [Leptospiraceae bacterium]
MILSFIVLIPLFIFSEQIYYFLIFLMGTGSILFYKKRQPEYSALCFGGLILFLQCLIIILLGIHTESLAFGIVSFFIFFGSALLLRYILFLKTESENESESPFGTVLIAMSFMSGPFSVCSGTDHREHMIRISPVKTEARITYVRNSKPPEMSYFRIQYSADSKIYTNEKSQKKVENRFQKKQMKQLK